MLGLNAFLLYLSNYMHFSIHITLTLLYLIRLLIYFGLFSFIFDYVCLFPNVVPGCLASAVVAPGGEGLEGEDAGDVDKDEPGPREAGLEHRVQADHVEHVQTVVIAHLGYVGQILNSIIFQFNF